jgi:hypothetical protein
MGLIKCSNQNVVKSCIILYIEEKYVPMVQKCTVFQYVPVCMFIPHAYSVNTVYFPNMQISQ